MKRRKAVGCGLWAGAMARWVQEEFDPWNPRWKEQEISKSPLTSTLALWHTRVYTHPLMCVRAHTHTHTHTHTCFLVSRKVLKDLFISILCECLHCICVSAPYVCFVPSACGGQRRASDPITDGHEPPKGTLGIELRTSGRAVSDH